MDKTLGARPLNFNPFHNLDHQLVGYLWRGHQISHFQTPPSQFVNLTEEFPTVLKSAYPKMTLPDFSRLYQTLLQEKLDIPIEKLFSVYNLKWTEDLQRVLIWLVSTPDSFQTWVSEKDLGPNELRPGLLFQGDASLLFSKIASWRPNRHLGSKILEFYFLNPAEARPLLESSKTAEGAYRALYQLHFPVTFQKDMEKDLLVKKFPWPAHVHAKWVRKGDLAGVQLELFCVDAPSFSKRVEALSNLSQKAQDLWK